MRPHAHIPALRVELRGQCQSIARVSIASQQHERDRAIELNDRRLGFRLGSLCEVASGLFVPAVREGVEAA